jgi:hypothetical protein
MVGVGRGWAIGTSSGERRRLNSGKEDREEFGVEGGKIGLWGEEEMVSWEDVELEVS